MLHTQLARIVFLTQVENYFEECIYSLPNYFTLSGVTRQEGEKSEILHKWGQVLQGGCDSSESGKISDF